jgi:hypothetical protein
MGSGPRRRGIRLSFHDVRLSAEALEWNFAEVIDLTIGLDLLEKRVSGCK